jgi:hypothetical protein
LHPGDSGSTAGEGAADVLSPARLAGLLAGFAILCWAALAIGNAPAPILHDMSEPYAWGRQFQLGYNQHPPFWAWICGAWFRLMPRTGWSFAALDAINATIGLAGAWALIGDFARGDRRVAAFGLLLLTPIYTIGAYKYDANTIFLSVWPWTTHAFVVALRSRRLAPSLAFGALVGVALLCKYYAALLIAACGLAALATRDGRAYLRSPRPWAAAAVAAAVFAPHAVWLIETGAPPLRYLGSASGLETQLVGRNALSAAAGVGASFAAVAAVVGYFAWTERGRPPAPAREADERRLLWILGLGPLALTFAAGLALRVKLTAEMPIGVLALVPLILIEAAGLADLTRLARFAGRAAIAATAAIALLSPLVMLGRAYLGANANHVSPYPEAAELVTRLWREKFDRPLAFVAGDEYAHPVAFYSPDRPQAFFDFDFAKNLWVTPADLETHGFAAVCAEADARCVAQAQALAGESAQRIELSASRRFLGHVAEPRRLVVVLRPPDPR